MRRDANQAGASLPRLPIRCTGFHTHALRWIGGRQHDAMTIFGAAAHGNRLAAQLGILVHFHARIETVQVAMQNDFTCHTTTSLGQSVIFPMGRIPRYK